MKIKFQVIATFLSKVLVSVLGLLMVILISRNLGAEGRGHIGLFMSSVALLQLVCEFGSSSAVINLSYKLNNRNLWLSALVWIGLVCLAALPVLYLFRDLPYVWLIPPVAFLYSFINLHQMLLMGKQKITHRNLSLLIMPALIIPLFLYIVSNYSASTDAYILALIPSLLISAALARFMLGTHPDGVGKGFKFETELLKQGLWAQGAQLVQFLNYRLNFFLVAIILGEAALGIYNNAVILCESVWILGHSIGQVQHMKILNTRDEKQHLQLSNKLLIYNVAGSLILTMGLMLIPNDLWTYLFSGDFSSMRSLFPLLIPGVLCFSISNILIHFMHARGLFRMILFCNTAGLAAGLTASLILIPLYGISGACLAWSTGLAFSMFFYIYRYKIIARDISENH